MDRNQEMFGIAVPQLGVMKRCIAVVIEKENGRKEIEFMINPKIVSLSKEALWNLEGCLSVPDYFGLIKRSAEIEMEYVNEVGNKQARKLSNFYAGLVQHEYDHLDGILYVDRLKSFEDFFHQSQTSMLLERYNKLNKMEGNL